MRFLHQAVYQMYSALIACLFPHWQGVSHLFLTKQVSQPCLVVLYVLLFECTISLQMPQWFEPLHWKIQNKTPPANCILKGYPSTWDAWYITFEGKPPTYMWLIHRKPSSNCPSSSGTARFPWSKILHQQAGQFWHFSFRRAWMQCSCKMGKVMWDLLRQWYCCLLCGEIQAGPDW